MKVPPPTKGPKNASQTRPASKTTRKELIEDVEEEKEEAEKVAVDEEFVKTVAENSNVVAFICKSLF